jgi:hypothetical protein
MMPKPMRHDIHKENYNIIIYKNAGIPTSFPVLFMYTIGLPAYGTKQN